MTVYIAPDCPPEVEKLIRERHRGERIVVGRSLIGTAPDVAGMLRRKAAAPIKPSKPQAPCDHGLFSDEADQLDLASLFRDR